MIIQRTAQPKIVSMKPTSSLKTEE